MASDSSTTSEAIRLLKGMLEKLRTDSQVKAFLQGTFRAWAFEVDTILVRSFGAAANLSRSKWSQVIMGLPYPSSYVTLGYEANSYKEMFKARLPEVEATLEAIIRELETFGAPEGADGTNGTYTTEGLHSTWRRQRGSK